MSKSTISTFQLFEMSPDEASARQYLEDRLWPEGPRCPGCKATERKERHPEGVRCPSPRLFAKGFNRVVVP
jgi:hypothetical protein